MGMEKFQQMDYHGHVSKAHWILTGHNQGLAAVQHLFKLVQIPIINSVPHFMQGKRELPFFFFQADLSSLLHLCYIEFPSLLARSPALLQHMCSFNGLQEAVFFKLNICKSWTSGSKNSAEANSLSGHSNQCEGSIKSDLFSIAFPICLLYDCRLLLADILLLFIS